jgi:hypothetical protein
LSVSFAICSLVAANTAGAQQEATQPNWHDVLSGTTGRLSAIGKVMGPTSKPQPGVPLEITGPPGKIYVFTDERGEWHVYNLPAGKYNFKPVGIGNWSIIDEAHRTAAGGLDNHTDKTIAGASFTVDAPGVLQRVFGGGEGTKVAADIKLQE